MSKKHTKVTPDTVKAVRAMYDSLPTKMRKASLVAKILGISDFTVTKIVRANFDFDTYRADIHDAYIHYKKIKLGVEPATATVSEESTKTEAKEPTNGDKLVTQVTELVVVMHDLLSEVIGIKQANQALVEAWNARPKKLEAESNQPRKTGFF